MQPGLFDSVDAHRLAEKNAKLEAQVERLKKENRSWERSYKRLKAERDAISQARLGDADHPLHTECQRLTKEVDDLRATLRQWVERELPWLQRGLAPGGLSKDALPKLLLLAHEIPVTLNAWRDRMGGQA